MENNSDKQLRDKLSNTEFPFDPQAWEQMEAMLDEKKKPRGFFWWWTSGVAAVLLLAVSSYAVREVVIGKEKLAAVNSSSKQPNTIVAGAEKAENTIAAEGSGNMQEKEKVKSEKLRANETAAVSNIEKAEKNSVGAGNKKIEKTKNNSSTASIRLNPSNPRHPRANVFSKGNKQLAIGNKQQHKSKKQETINSKPLTPVQQEIEMLNDASSKANTAEENISLSRREASLLEYVSEKATTCFDKKEEEVLPKQKKKIFSYSIGVLANVSGTTLGNQSTHNPNVPIRNRPTSFYTTPSFMVGITHDFLFINRVAITNAVLFSQTSFRVYNPKTVSFSVTPTNYISRITELTIPIGIKVYPVVKNNFRFYISTGIINHIKLKETFDYTLPTDTPISAIPNNVFSQADLPAETNFGKENTQADALSSTGGPTSTKDFSINSAKRYYASFYAGAGFEYVAKKHFIVFGEPMFYLSLQKIGVQEKRKYNIGLTGGFRYQF